jgi:hypothetical protein
MASTGADAEAWNTRGKGGKDIVEKNGDINDETIMIRIEHTAKYNEYEEPTYNCVAAITAIVEAIVNYDDETTLVALKGAGTMDNFEPFSNQLSFEEFVKSVSIISNDKRSIRYSSIIKIKSAMKFNEIATKYEVKNATSTHKTRIYHHRLGPACAEAKLIYNVFKVIPHLNNKLDYEDKINNAIKAYVNTANKETKSKIGETLYRYIMNTNYNIIEIGKRYWSSEFEGKQTGKNDTVNTAECEVFTMRCRGDLSQKIKTLITNITWPEAIFGTFMIENPTTFHTKANVHLACLHNEMSDTSAYVKLVDLPNESLQIKVGNETVEEKIMSAISTDRNKLFRSINTINKERGIQYVITTQALFTEAEEFISTLLEDINGTIEHSNNLQFINWRNEHVTMVSRLSPSLAGSTTSRHTLHFGNTVEEQKTDMNEGYTKYAQSRRQQIKHKKDDTNKRIIPTFIAWVPSNASTTSAASTVTQRTFLTAATTKPQKANSNNTTNPVQPITTSQPASITDTSTIAHPPTGMDTNNTTQLAQGMEEIMRRLQIVEEDSKTWKEKYIELHEDYIQLQAKYNDSISNTDGTKDTNKNEDITKDLFINTTSSPEYAHKNKIITVSDEEGKRKSIAFEQDNNNTPGEKNTTVIETPIRKISSGKSEKGTKLYPGDNPPGPCV